MITISYNSVYFCLFWPKKLSVIRLWLRILPALLFLDRAGLKLTLNWWILGLWKCDLEIQFESNKQLNLHFFTVIKVDSCLNAQCFAFNRHSSSPWYCHWCISFSVCTFSKGQLTFPLNISHSETAVLVCPRPGRPKTWGQVATTFTFPPGVGKPFQPNGFRNCALDSRCWDV